MIRRITQALILITVAIWIAWDLYATHHPGATESEVIRDWQVAYPPLAWGIGVLFGHFTMLGNRLASRWILIPLTAAVVFAADRDRPRHAGSCYPSALLFCSCPSWPI